MTRIEMFSGSRVLAACCALLLSATMVLSSVGPAFTVPAAAQSASLIA